MLIKLFATVGPPGGWYIWIEKTVEMQTLPRIGEQVEAIEDVDVFDVSGITHTPTAGRPHVAEIQLDINAYEEAEEAERAFWESEGWSVTNL